VTADRRNRILLWRDETVPIGLAKFDPLFCYSTRLKNTVGILWMADTNTHG